MTGIPPADMAAFRNSGLAHLLSVSGLHIAIVMGIAMGAVRMLLAAWPYAALHWPCKRIAVLAGLACGGFYMVLTGSQVPMVRSFADGRLRRPGDAGGPAGALDAQPRHGGAGC